MVRKTLATFRLPIKQIIPLFRTPKKIKYPLHCTCNFFWELKAKKAILMHFGGGGGGGREQGVLLKVIKNEYFLEETGYGERTPR